MVSWLLLLHGSIVLQLNINITMKQYNNRTMKLIKTSYTYFATAVTKDVL